MKQLSKHTKALNHLKQVWQTSDNTNWDYLLSQIERIEKKYIHKLNTTQLREFNVIKSAYTATFDKKEGRKNG